jgi:hypothetical protein
MEQLTIAIPTYDRPKAIANCVRRIWGQLNQNVRLLVLDNASPQPVEEILLAEFGAFPANVKIIRNLVNIGGNANLLRCFESCETEFMWLLGDDDWPEPNAVATILNDIQRKDVRLINYYVKAANHAVRGADMYFDGPADLLRHAHNIGELLCISANIYHVSSHRVNLKYGSQYASSCMPHLCLSLMALNGGGKVLLSSRSIISKPETDPSEWFSMAQVCILMPVVLDLPLTTEVRDCLRRLLRPTLLGWPGILPSILELCVQWKRTGDSQLLRYRLRTLDRRWISETGRPVHRLTILVARLLSIFPRVLTAAVFVLARTRGRDPDSLPGADSYAKRT